MITWFGSRRGTPIRSGTRPGGVAAVLLASLLLVGCEAGPSGDVGQGPGSPDALPLAASDNEFTPATIEVRAGAETQVQIRNDGDATHDFTIESLDLSTGPIESNAVAHATFVVPEGTTTFTCSIHPGMEGRIEGRS